MDYTELNGKLQGRNKQGRKIANNTYLERRGDDIALRLHSTDIVTFKPNGDKVLNSGGWHTHTTKARINDAGIRLSQDKGVWFIGNIQFQDNMVIHANGDVTGGIKNNPKADIKFKAKVKAYAKLYAENLPLDKPDNGDCWFCHMVTEDKQSLGDVFKDTEHLTSHMKEKYIVPSLAYNALKESNAGDLIMSLTFNNPEKHMLGVAEKYVYRAVYKYILKRFGYAI